MIRHLKVIRAEGNDPVMNLSLESALADSVGSDEIILYLWQNADTVVIGKNQNIWKECSIGRMEQDGITAVRRPSGGGAVFHDLGNLNFTFIARDADYDEEKQTAVILHALETFGIKAEKTGRNDLLAEGRKFSGHAYSHHKGRSVHHGTLLIHSDLSRIPLYLRPDPLKLKANSVDSARSRVRNLSELLPSLTIAQMMEALIESCEEIYGCSREPMAFPDAEAIESYRRIYGSREWIYNRNSAFTAEVSHRFPWGTVTLSLQAENGMIQDAVIWTDAMDTEQIEQAAACLKGCQADNRSLIRALKKQKQTEVTRDLILWLTQEPVL